MGGFNCSFLPDDDFQEGQIGTEFHRIIGSGFHVPAEDCMRDGQGEEGIKRRREEGGGKRSGVEGGMGEEKAAARGQARWGSLLGKLGRMIPFVARSVCASVMRCTAASAMGVP